MLWRPHQQRPCHDREEEDDWHFQGPRQDNTSVKTKSSAWHMGHEESLKIFNHYNFSPTLVKLMAGLLKEGRQDGLRNKWLRFSLDKLVSNASTLYLCVLYKLRCFWSITKLHCVSASSSGFPVHPASWHGHWVSSPARPFTTRTTAWDLTTTVPPSDKYKTKNWKLHIKVKSCILASKLRNKQKLIETAGNKQKQCIIAFFFQQA